MAKRIKPIRSQTDEDEVYQAIREEYMDDFDDPGGEDEDTLNRTAEDVFEDRYGYKRGEKKYPKKPRKL